MYLHLEIVIMNHLLTSIPSKSNVFVSWTCFNEISRQLNDFFCLILHYFFVECRTWWGERRLRLTKAVTSPTIQKLLVYLVREPPSSTATLVNFSHDACNDCWFQYNDVIMWSVQQENLFYRFKWNFCSFHNV